MAIDTNIQTFTNAELLKLVRLAIANVLVGGASYAINGRSFTRADLSELRKTEAELSDVVETELAGESGGGLALVRFGERV